MDSYMELIMSNLNRLIPLINGNFISDLIAYREVLTQEDWDIIYSKDDNDAKTESLLLAIGRSGPDAMYALKDILAQTENFRAIEILNSGPPSSSTLPRATSSRFIPGREGVRSSHTRSYSSCDDSDHGFSNGNLTGEHFLEGKIYQSPTGTVSIKPEHQFLVKTEGKLKEGPDIYPCKSDPRGFCIIINNVDFEVFDQRASAEEDGAFLASIFKQLGYQLNYFKNLSAGDIEAVFQKYSKMDSLKDHDALVCIIMSHGLKCDLIVGSDGLYVRLETLLSYFNNFNCPLLMNKPKLFFIQACRGDEYDFGIMDATTTADAGPVPGPVIFTKKTDPDRIPTWSDMCIVQSTIQGYVALRSVQSGSWFAEALGWALIDHAWEKSLHEILMVVSSKLSKREGKKSVKQAIEVIWRGWNKSLYFNPGIYNSNHDNPVKSTNPTNPPN
ncbi:caspase-7-like isoform X2 [Panonychus citri]|uniref:caspase-7-like isoform X2 n=1 Tax=Panonychus citri TaxID=50023 RepID=UPI0023070C63|nr:caspase-7-like isoform X2 [Panonychus citri]